VSFDAAALAAPFPADAVSWRAQTLNQAGNSAMALAYIDARDVMRRLDEVCGPENWSDSYAETAKGRVIGTIAIRIGDAWVSKADGAGDTDVEGAKGGLSDAFKRAAVKWGVGRYLYDLDAVWAECETYERNGKKHWKKWTTAGERKLRDALGSRPTAVSSPLPAAANAAVVDGHQWSELTTLVSQTGSDAAAICRHYSVPSLRELPAARFEALRRNLTNRLTQDREAA